MDWSQEKKTFNSKNELGPIILRCLKNGNWGFPRQKCSNVLAFRSFNMLRKFFWIQIPIFSWFYGFWLLKDNWIQNGEKGSQWKVVGEILSNNGPIQNERKKE